MPSPLPPLLPPSTLRPGQVRVVNASEGLTLTVLQGRLWVTAPNDWQDHFVAAGQALRLTTPGVVLEADRPERPAPAAEVRYTLAPVCASNAHEKSGTRAALFGWGLKPPEHAPG
mgnify:CR=1 FL=1